MAFKALASAALVAVAAGTAAVEIGNVTMPIGFTWDSQGRVYIAEKNGRVKTAPSFTSANAGPAILDISSKVATYGDFGLMAIDVDASSDGNTYLYAAYMARNPAFGNNCTDNGMANGRPNSAIAGCPTTGQISRWRLVDGAVIGNEQPLIGGFNLVCAQFRVHGVDYLLAQDNVLYFSVGAGDNANIQPDYGQFGGDPCGGGGAFRAQDANGLNGKILRYDIASNTTTVLAKGLKNPWRFTIANNGIYTAEPGAGIYDEINGPVSLSATTPVNYGAPCWEGINNPSTTYMATNASLCSAVAPAASVTNPVYAYSPPDANSRISISAIGFRPAASRIYWGDYTASMIS